MVTSLLDTSIIIDLIRGFPDAHEWLRTNDDTLGITRYVWLEVIQGAFNKQKQTAAITLLSEFQIIALSLEDMEWAVQALIKTRLAYNVDVLDCLIASTAYRLNIPLYTRNLKHFKPLLGELTLNPY